MTALAQGSSITLALQDGGQVSISTNGGLASVIATPTGGVAQSQNLGPLPVRVTVGPFSEGASVTIYNQNAVLDYDRPGGNVATITTDPLTGEIVELSGSGVPIIGKSSNKFGLAKTKPLTAVGTYAGTASAFAITLPWVPDLFVVKDVSAATSAQWILRGVGWLAKGNTFTNTAGVDNGLVINADGTVTIGTSGGINTNAANYEWFAYKDNGNDNLLLCNHAGNDQPTRTLRYAADKSVKAAIFKRDSTQYPVIAVRGKTAKNAVGGASTSATINADGTITIGQGADINEWTSNLGEGVTFAGITDGAQGIYASTYMGTGASKPLLTPFEELEAVLIFPRGTGGAGNGVLWTSRLAAGVSLGLESVTAATVGAQCITAVNQGRISLGTSGRVNALGVEYLVIAFRRNRQGAPVESALGARPLRSTKHLVLSAAAYINCGTSDTLAINGPITLEWWGAHFMSTPVSYPTSATNNDNQSIQQPLIWRSNGADGVVGSVSYGLQIQAAQSANVANPLGVAVTNLFDFPQNSSAYDVDNTQPWCTGVSIQHRALHHVMATHDGNGFWRVYVDGVLFKERDRNMLQAATPRPNVSSGAGHTFCIGARKRDSTPTMTSYTQAFFGARVYARELSATEVRANYDSLFSDNTSSATTGFVEQWLAENSSGSDLPASVNAANSGAFVGSVVLEGL